MMAKLTETTNDQLSKRRGRPPKLVAENGHTQDMGAGLGNGLAQNMGVNMPPWPSMPVIPFTHSIKSPADFTIPQAAPVPEAQPLKIALIGTAPSSRMLAPYNDPSWKIWACSPGNMNVLPRVDAWFEIHGSLLWPENKHYGEPYLQWLSQLKIPVYMQDNRYIPNATPLPKDELVKEFGPYYFTSSFSWMMAMAMREGAKEIMLFGIDMASRDEYILQRPGAYHFFQEAQRRGIRISAPYESDIMQPPGLYGYSEVTPMGRKLIARMQELKERLGGLRSQRDTLNTNITYLEGAVEDLDYVQSIWSGAQNNPHPDMRPVDLTKP